MAPELNENQDRLEQKYNFQEFGSKVVNNQNSGFFSHGPDNKQGWRSGSFSTFYIS